MQQSFRIPADDTYTAILGRAVYNFAYYEWVVVWTLEKLRPGYLQYYSRKGPTSGRVAESFTEAVKSFRSASPDQDALAICAATFDGLRKERDKLLHAHPYTAAAGVQQLGYRGRHPATEWPMAEVEDVAEKFDAAACELNHLFYKFWP
jgi:hypothetical protein